MQKFKELSLKHKILAVLGIVLLCIIMFFYIRYFNEEIMEYGEVELIYSNENDVNTYSKKFGGMGEVLITAEQVSENGYEVIYKLLNDMSFYRKVTYNNEENITVEDEKGIIYEGNIADIPFDIISVTAPGIYSQEDSIPKIYDTLNFITTDEVHKRGNIFMIVLAILLAIGLAIDVKYPRLAFNIEHFLSVDNPEPSDFYILMQKIRWFVIIPIMIIICLVRAITAPMY